MDCDDEGDSFRYDNSFDDDGNERERRKGMNCKNEAESKAEEAAPLSMGDSKDCKSQ